MYKFQLTNALHTHPVSQFRPEPQHKAGEVLY